MDKWPIGVFASVDAGLGVTRACGNRRSECDQKEGEDANLAWIHRCSLVTSLWLRAFLAQDSEPTPRARRCLGKIRPPLTGARSRS